MRLLLIHSDDFRFEAKKKAIESAEKIEQNVLCGDEGRAP